MNLLQRDQKYVWHPYTQMKTAPQPTPIVRGDGAYLIHEDGRAIIDAISSWWVNIHGHANSYIAERVSRQLRELEHVIFAGFTHPPAVDLAERLLGVLPANQSRIFYSDNGSTAVEIGVKMAIQSFHNRGRPRRKLIAFDRAFHGETFGGMSASGDLSLFNAFREHLFEVLRIPTPVAGQEEESLRALESQLEAHDVYAFLFEPLVMGAGGMIMYEPAILDRLIEKCREAGVLCIADEVMTGFGRTGKIFASQYLENAPDIMCMSKGLTGGTLPLAATSCTEAVYEAFLSEDRLKTFFHGHSYTANPVGCAAALASMDLLESEERRRDLERIAARHRGFADRIRQHPAVGNLRQRGTIIALEYRTSEATSYFNRWRDRLYSFFMEKNILLRPLGNVIYVMPPYCITDEQLERVYAAIEASLELFATELAASRDDIKQ